MAVTKRTRFEVLRRDDHTCQYCGAKAPDVTLQIDHVVPVALGGNDKPGNLVTACRDCNAGKSSVAPDAPIVEKLSAEASAYALGMVDKMTRFRADLESLEDYVYLFREQWDAWGSGKGEERKKVPLPADYEMSLFRWKQIGVPISAYELAIPPAMLKQKIPQEGRFAYMAGIIWNMLDAREIDYSVTDENAAVMTASEVNEIQAHAYSAGREAGWLAGVKAANRDHLANDFLQHHIDQTEMVTVTTEFYPHGTYMTGGVRERGEGVRPAAA